MSENITITMPLKEYEEMQENIMFWQCRFNALRRVILTYAEKSEIMGAYRIDNVAALTKAVEDYLNNEH